MRVTSTTPSLVVLSMLAAAVGCADAPAPGPASIRLVDVLPAATIEGSPAASTPDPVIWSFGDGLAPGAAEPEDERLGWRGFGDVADLEVRDGLLHGRTTGDAGHLTVAIPGDLHLQDQLHAIEVRMRVSDGTVMGAFLSSDEELDEETIVEEARRIHGASLFSTGIAPAQELDTVTVSATASMDSSVELAPSRHLVIRPTEAAGAEFAIESVRIVSRVEHLAALPTGIGWHGLGDIFRETVVTRAPERVSFDVTLPSDPWLELYVGTLEDAPVRFEVTAVEEGDRHELLRRTVSMPERWEAVPVDLAGLAGRQVTLTFATDAEEDGTLAYWGTPVVRQRRDTIRAVDASPALLELAPELPKPRGVVFILADTLRRDRLPWHGGQRDNAPHLARLAEEGAVFTRAVSQGTWTKVAVSSLLTSLYASSHGITDMAHRLPASVTTLEEGFLEAGYATFHTSSVPFTGRLSNLHQGAEVLHESASVPEVGHSSSKTARAFVDRVLPWIERHRDSPFYAFLHVFDPHSPFEPYSPWDTYYMDEGEPEAHRQNLETVVEHIESGFMKMQLLPTAEELDAAGIDADAFVDSELDWYDASIRAMDVEVGRLLERLESLGRLDDTLIVFVADHGEEFLEHGEHWHGHQAYGEMINVPLFLWWPGVIPSQRVDEVVQSIDVYPTVAELARLPVPEEAQGQSLLPLLASPDNPSRLGWQRRAAFSERAINHGSEIDDDEVESFVIVADGWKLIRNTTRPDGWPEYELYDFESDPFDQNDLAVDNPEVVERLAAEIDAWREMALAERVQEASMAEMTPEEIARLRSLGYIQ